MGTTAENAFNGDDARHEVERPEQALVLLRHVLVLNRGASAFAEATADHRSLGEGGRPVRLRAEGAPARPRRSRFAAEAGRTPPPPQRAKHARRGPRSRLCRAF